MLAMPILSSAYWELITKCHIDIDQMFMMFHIPIIDGMQYQETT